MRNSCNLHVEPVFAECGRCKDLNGDLWRLAGGSAAYGGGDGFGGAPSWSSENRGFGGSSSPRMNTPAYDEPMRPDDRMAAFGGRYDVPGVYWNNGLMPNAMPFTGVPYAC
jgi:hypothetical protein